jgi:DNA-binding response OmpR family regulator
VCYADDDALLRRVTSMTLKLAQFDADVFEDGLAAAVAIERAPEAYDLIILDASMVRRQLGACQAAAALRFRASSPTQASMSAE